MIGMQFRIGVLDGMNQLKNKRIRFVKSLSKINLDFPLMVYKIWALAMRSHGYSYEKIREFVHFAYPLRFMILFNSLSSYLFSLFHWC